MNSVDWLELAIKLIPKSFGFEFTQLTIIANLKTFRHSSAKSS